MALPLYSSLNQKYRNSIKSKASTFPSEFISARLRNSGGTVGIGVDVGVSDGVSVGVGVGEGPGVTVYVGEGVGVGVPSMAYTRSSMLTMCQGAFLSACVLLLEGELDAEKLST